MKQFSLSQPFHNSLMSRLKQERKFTKGIHDQHFICEQCHGHGEYTWETKSNLITCPTCDGKGKILIRFTTQRVN